MSQGKDEVLFVSAEELASVTEAVDAEDLAELKQDEKNEEEDMQQAVGPDGEIDWSCPCLKGMADGVCGESFKEAFSCFVHSEADPKGSDCVEAFTKMHECIMAHPEEYGGQDDDDQDTEQQPEHQQDQEQPPGGETATSSSPDAAETKAST
eukprot:m.486552 g.486552  ORF g.486552 m.486552 type:complete len:152 (+) comp24490_c0_seq1:500-955(+)